MKILLQIACFALFVGHAWQHLMKGGPYRSFLLDDYLMRRIAERLGYHWADLLQDPQVDASILMWGKGIGVFFLIAAIVVLLIEFTPRWLVWIFLFGGAFFLLLMSFSIFIEKAWIWAQWLEYSAQISTPIFLYFYQYKKVHPPKMVNALKVVIAITFACHALFAMGVFPIPGNFIDMVIYGFGVNETMARHILLMVGVLDTLIAILLFMPKKGIVYFALAYAATWGFLTTIARGLTTYQADLGWYSLKQWLPEVLFRFPHFLLPIVALVILYKWVNRHRKIGL